MPHEFCLHLKQIGLFRLSLVRRRHTITLAAQRLSSAAFEATTVFAVAKMGGGSNVRCSDLLCAFILQSALVKNLVKLRGRVIFFQIELGVLLASNPRKAIEFVLKLT